MSDALRRALWHAAKMYCREARYWRARTAQAEDTIEGLRYENSELRAMNLRQFRTIQQLQKTQLPEVLK